MTVAYISHPDCLEHQMGAGHPESPQRLNAIGDRLLASGLDFLLRHYDAPLVRFEQLARVHEPGYIRAIEAAAPELAGELRWLDGDTAMTCHTLTAAYRSAGAAVLGVDLVLEDEIQAAFCCTRPPGHHAGRKRAMGFCFFNNLAVATAHALEWHRLERVAIVDFDVHRGNGTEEIFSGDDRVLFCNSYQHPFYPYVDIPQKANTLNLPLPAGTDGAAWRGAVKRSWLRRLDTFAPQLILVSAGFDAHAEDDMAGFNLREPDYAWITRELRLLADRHADGRIVSCLEGGYSLSALGRSAAAHIDELVG